MILQKKSIIIVLLLVLTAGLLPAAEMEEEEPKKPFVPFVLNTIPGLGIGSFIMGDPTGGFIGLGGELLGAGLFGGGVLYLMSASLAAGFGAVLTLGLAEPEIDASPAIALMASGLLVWTGSKLFEMIRPFTFAAKYNREAGLAQAVPGVTMSLVSSEEGYRVMPTFYIHKKL